MVVQDRGIRQVGPRFLSFNKMQSGWCRLTFCRQLSSPMITLKVGPDTLEHPAVILYAHSEVLQKLPFFAAALSGNFLEATTHVIKMPEDNPEIVAKLIQFLYTGTYTIDKELIPPLSAAAKLGADGKRSSTYHKLFHASVFLLAEKYDCKYLLKLSSTNMDMIALEESWERLAYWVSVYEASPPQSALRIANSLSTYRAASARSWILRLWEDEGGGSGARKKEGKLIQVFTKCPELARDLLVLASGATK